MNGVPRPKSAKKHQNEDEIRQMKQNYLMENVINQGYDPEAFAQFMEQQIEGGTNVDNWDFEELKKAVTLFQDGNEKIPVEEEEEKVQNDVN